MYGNLGEFWAAGVSDWYFFDNNIDKAIIDKVAHYRSMIINLFCS